MAHQRCWVQKLRNLEDKLKRSQHECLQQAKLIYQAAHRGEAVARFGAWKARWRRVAPEAVACVKQELEELLAPKAFGAGLLRLAGGALEDAAQQQCD